MSAAATETSCFGDTSTASIFHAEPAARHHGARGDQLLGELAVLAERHVRLRDIMLRFLYGRQIYDLIAHLSLYNLAVWRLDEAVFVYPRIGGERVDQADIGALRRLDRANAAVVGGMHVPHLEAGPLTRESAGAQCRKAPLMGDFGQRVGLVHELRKLR